MLPAWHTGMVCIGMVGAVSWFGGLTLVSALVVGRQGQPCPLCEYTTVGSHGSPACASAALALEGEALMSLMDSVPLSEVHPLPPTERVGQWQGEDQQSHSALFL